MSKVLLLGKNGQLGYEINQLLSDQYDLTALDSADLDLTNTAAIRETIRTVKPGLVINAAAYTAVDKAESDLDVARAVNAMAPAVLAEELAKISGTLIHYSTDYVFDGNASTPYREVDETSPQSVYGQTKLEGEQAIAASGVSHLIFRTSWVYGPRGHNFLLTMLRLLQERDELNVVEDQLGAPTSSLALADASVEILKQLQEQKISLGECSGIYHMTCQGQTSWFGFAETIARYLEKQGKPVAELHPIPSSEYPVPAKRPAWSVLDNHKLKQVFGVQLPGWQEALQRVFAELDA